jgi:hypothetical protein
MFHCEMENWGVTIVTPSRRRAIAARPELGCVLHAWSSLRSDPRFQVLLRRMNFPP